MTDPFPPAQLDHSLGPNSTIGIVGGGQLGRMLASAAAKLGFRTVVLEPGKDCPAAQVCNLHIEAPYADENALAQMAELCDVITYEFENVPLTTASTLQNIVPLYPPAFALEVSQHRLVEKDFLTNIGVQVADYEPVQTSNELVAALQKFGGGVLKTCRFGYDGKGQQVFAEAAQPTEADLNKAVAGASIAADGRAHFVLEKLIPFTSEFSLIAARSASGEVAIYAPSTNEHEDGILRRSTVPCKANPAHVEAAKIAAEKILQALNYVGVIGVEFFDTPEGVLVNEIAPRVHNTGHWTLEACSTSQFEQHIRAITNHPLGSTEMTSNGCEMVNLLGDEALDIAPLLSAPNCHVTLYGKAEARQGRKMGHITRTKPSF